MMENVEDVEFFAEVNLAYFQSCLRAGISIFKSFLSARIKSGLSDPRITTVNL